jgi:class 3 adenylate cyclase/YHS domain-containing protein
MGQEIDVALLIADLSGYTAFTEAHGALEAANTVTRYVEIAQAALQPGARLVERVGDEILILAKDIEGAVRTATALQSAVEQEPFFPTVRVGLHAGRILEQEQRYFGTALNLTARVAAYARGMQILCTERVAFVTQELDAVACRQVGLVHFKNIVAPVSVFEILTEHADSESPVIDPVCRMQVRPETAPARLPFGGQSYSFCSFECAKMFAECPDSYTRT